MRLRPRKFLYRANFKGSFDTDFKLTSLTRLNNRTMSLYSALKSLTGKAVKHD